MDLHERSNNQVRALNRDGLGFNSEKGQVWFNPKSWGPLGGLRFSKWGQKMVPTMGGAIFYPFKGLGKWWKTVGSQKPLNHWGYRGNWVLAPVDLSSPRISSGGNFGGGTRDKRGEDFWGLINHWGTSFGSNRGAPQKFLGGPTGETHWAGGHTRPNQ